jgi:LPXTG-motif cell wall-anchored protein
MLAVATAIALALLPANPAGAVTNSVHAAFAGTLSINGSTPVVIDGINGTADGTVDDAGNLTLPKAAISFPPFHAGLVGGSVDAVITIEPTATWTGTIDQHSGAVNIHAPQIAHIDLSSVFAVDTDCPVGPLDLNLTTGTSGNAHGSPLSASSGKADVVDGLFPIPGFPDNPAPANCGDAGELNGLAGLPLNGGVSTATFTVTFNPKQPVPPAPPGAPNAVPDSAKTNVNTPVTINVLANDTPGKAGLPINPASLAVSKVPMHGKTTVNTTDHMITYTPASGFHGLDFFTYELCSQLPATTTTTSTTTALEQPQAVAAAAVTPQCAHATVTVTVVSTTPITVASVATTTTATTVAAAAELPHTGSTSGPLALMGFAFVVGGLSVIGVARGRRRVSRSASTR